MEQKTDWMRPAARPAATADVFKVVNAPKAAAAPARPAPSIDEELDRNELAELARKLEDRTP